MITIKPNNVNIGIVTSRIEDEALSLPSAVFGGKAMILIDGMECEAFERFWPGKTPRKCREIMFIGDEAASVIYVLKHNWEEFKSCAI